jgi:CheY-like chemotaxis protein/ketosteroid isomerase-like protein
VPRLLVIEDHADMLEMTTLLLERGGYDVVGVATPDQAAAALEKGSYDLVVADLVLDSSGIEDNWKRIDQFVDLARPARVGMLTAWRITPDDERNHNLAFVLHKPCSRDQLFDRLATTLFLPQLDAARQHVLRSYFRCIERGAFDELGSLCVEDVVYRLPGSDPRFCREIRGRHDFLAFTSQTFEAFRDPQFELGSIRPLPEGAMVEYVGSWREDGTTRRMPGAVMFEFRDDRFSTIQVRVDPDLLG